MKAQMRMLALLGAVLLILIAVCSALMLSKKTEQTDPTAQELILLHECASTQITDFTLEGASGESAFALTADGWRYNGDPHFPLNADFVNGALTTLSRIDAVRAVISDADDLSPYGLTAPQMRVRFTDAEGEHAYCIGDYNSFTGYHYLCAEGERAVYLIDMDLVTLCSSEQKQMLTLGSLPDTYKDGEITAVTVGERRIDATDDAFAGLSEQLGALSLTDYADYYIEESEREGYGLTAPTMVKIEYAATQPSGATDATVACAYTLTLATPDETYVYFTVEGSDILYRMKRDDLPALCAVLDG